MSIDIPVRERGPLASPSAPRSASPPLPREDVLRVGVGRFAWERPGLIGILAVSALLELWHLNQLGYANQFYAAAVYSMLQNWHAFFFNSFDANGFVTIDKPPLGFWVQLLSARLLGFSGFSILLPEALATVGSVALVAHLVRRAFGSGTGLLAGLMLALVPISVVVGRNNTIDALLVVTLVLTVWTALRATERGSLRWLLATAVLVGLGFEIKMLEAYLVVPALGLVYLLGAPSSLRTRVGHLALAAVVMLIVSLAWPIAVDLTPASMRPWIDSTQDNSAISLALGYNGIERLIGQRGSISQFVGSLTSSGTSDGMDFGGGMFNNGPAGVLRLFDAQLAGQASWLLPLALVGLIGAIWPATRDRRQLVESRQVQAGIVWGTWLLAAGAFFSVASFFHSYYLVTLGPPIAALAAIGVHRCWHTYRARGRFAWVLPVALLGTGLVQLHILSTYPTWSAWLAPLVLGGTTLGAAMLLAVLIAGWLHRPLARRQWFTHAATGLAIAALLVAPAVWSGYSVTSGFEGGIPSAGPQAQGAGSPFGGTPPAFARRAQDDQPPTASAATADGGGQPQAGSAADGGAAGADGQPFDGMGFGAPGGEASAALIAYLEANQGSASYLVATMNSNSAASIILSSGKPVMSLGGFSGDDPILTVDQLASLVQAGEVRYVLLGGGPGGGQGSTRAIAQWVQANGTLVSAAAIGSSDGQSTQLYDLSGVARAAA
jgi:4-amino-4-deoxy-L-arabinose transferase-like glycosyltransferase